MHILPIESQYSYPRAKITGMGISLIVTIALAALGIMAIHNQSLNPLRFVFLTGGSLSAISSIVFFALAIKQYKAWQQELKEIPEIKKELHAFLSDPNIDQLTNRKALIQLDALSPENIGKVLEHYPTAFNKFWIRDLIKSQYFSEYLKSEKFLPALIFFIQNCLKSQRDDLIKVILEKCESIDDQQMIKVLNALVSEFKKKKDFVFDPFLAKLILTPHIKTDVKIQFLEDQKVEVNEKLDFIWRLQVKPDRIVEILEPYIIHLTYADPNLFLAIKARMNIEIPKLELREKKPNFQEVEKMNFSSFCETYFTHKNEIIDLLKQKVEMGSPTSSTKHEAFETHE